MVPDALHKEYLRYWIHRPVNNLVHLLCCRRSNGVRWNSCKAKDRSLNWYLRALECVRKSVFLCVNENYIGESRIDYGCKTFILMVGILR